MRSAHSSRPDATVTAALRAKSTMRAVVLSEPGRAAAAARAGFVDRQARRPRGQPLPAGHCAARARARAGARARGRVRRVPPRRARPQGKPRGRPPPYQSLWAPCRSSPPLWSPQGAFPFMQRPTVLGHEVAGVVDKVGPGVERLAVGQRVASLHWASCGQCASCRYGAAPTRDAGGEDSSGQAGGGRRHRRSPTRAIAAITCHRRHYRPHDPHGRRRRAARGTRPAASARQTFSRSPPTAATPRPSVRGGCRLCHRVRGFGSPAADTPTPQWRASPASCRFPRAGARSRRRLSNAR